MKKLLAFILSAILMLSLCCCGGSAGSTNGVESKADDPKPSSNPYVGVWYHAKTDAEPFQMTLRLFEDGTADMGKVSESYTMTWSESDDGIVITTNYNDYQPKDEPAKLLDDGSLKWDMEFKLSSNGTEYDHVTFKKQ